MDVIKIWVTSDTHFGHEKLSEDGLRPVGFSEKVIKALGMAISPSDILIHLGDVAFKEEVLWHERLSHIECRKWLVRGNHDKRSLSWYLNHGWDWVGDSMSLDVFGKRLLLSHVPMDIKEYDLNIHGHFHAFGMARVLEVEPELHKLVTVKHKLVSLEHLSYQPVKLQRLTEGS